MAVNPTGSCIPCQKIKEVVKNASDNVNFHFIKYLLFYLLLVEISTMFLNHLPSYAFKIFPAVTQFGYVCFLYFFYLHRFKLKFCRRKRLVVNLLILYYFSKPTSTCPLFPRPIAETYVRTATVVTPRLED